MCSEVGVFWKCGAVFYVWIHGTVKWACEDFEGCVETCVYCGCKDLCDSPLVGYFRECALWVEAFGSWMVTLHEVCEISDEVV